MANGVAKFVFWDVQHGSACYISTPNGRDIVIDLGVGSYGASDATFSPLLHLKKKWGVHQLDAVIITHPHRDHLDDIHNFDKLDPVVLYRPRHLTHDEIRAANKEVDSPILEKYFEIDARYTGPIPAPDPLSAEGNGGLILQSFTPKHCPTNNLNNHSIITVASYAHSKIIIPGDNESPSWKELLSNPEFVDAISGSDILVAAHHGREAGYCDEVFHHVSPRLTIISDGPFLETSATDWYSAKSKGWKVHNRSGGSEDRKCVTTRCDGVTVVELAMEGERPYLKVTID